MSIDWKLFRTLVAAGFVLIVVHAVLANWGDFKRGFSAGLKGASRPASGSNP